MSTIIVINALSAREGGGQTYLRNILEHVPKESTVSIYVLAPGCLKKDYDSRVKFLNSSAALDNPFLRTLWEISVLPFLLQKLRADILFSPGGLVIGPVPKQCRIVTMFRNMIPFDNKQRERYPAGYHRLRNFLLNYLIRKSMLKAHLVIFVSNHARMVMHGALNGTAINAVVIPHGISDIFFKGATPGTGILPDLPSQGYLLYVSRLDFYKSQMEVVKAYHRLKITKRIKEKLLLVGSENRDYGKLLRNTISRLDLSEDVRITGPVPHEQLPLLYQMAAVNIYASESENCPNILLESMASGTATVASSCQPMPEFAGSAVVYFNPSDPIDIADKLLLVLTDKKIRESIKLQAINHALRYRWENSASSTWKAIITTALDSDS